MADVCWNCAFARRNSVGGYVICKLDNEMAGSTFVCSRYQPSSEYQADLRAEREAKLDRERREHDEKVRRDEQEAEEKRIQQEESLRRRDEQRRKKEEDRQWYKDNASDLITGAVVIAGGAAYLLSRHQEKKSQGPDPRVVAQRSTLKRSKWVAAFLAIFFGMFGAQKFYLDHPKQGVILLLVSIIGAIIVIGPIVSWTIGIVEGIMYLISSPEKFQETYVKGTKVWF